MKVVKRVTELIGNTPLLQLQRIADSSMAEVWVKLEKFNPGGSVKDRPAQRMIEAAEQAGTLHPGMTIIEPTSGNTGIGIAMVAAAKGYRAILVMPDTMTWERIAILKAYGAQVVLTPGNLRMSGAVQKAQELKTELGDQAMILLQFENPNNPDAHRTSTALEILEQTDRHLDAFVASAGTGGTITGCGEVLKEHIPGVKVYVVEPKGSPVLSGGQPGPHKLVGTSPGFIPKILNTNIYDKIYQVADEEAIEMTKRLAREEALLVGVSAGAVVYTALQVAKDLGPGKRVVALCPDTGERYLSMDLF
ncbi:cysteine synthase A [Sulfoacidibacillus ferrooxidans]|uniref:Cysteine synthase n=1 Tax=Sulfoacidibacillus ferrooxidans TaxID=2005001 RepID=A0A9X1V7G8_9BACL|nr:cysteine synthase A [Sulfoacidibacillus ferrooxidans]MCI0183091.1 Cysteine synthase [Sulfoacidibacillus ferrooxidans]